MGSPVLPQNRVLIVDDSALQRHMLSGICIKAGLEIETAENGLEGLNLVKKKAFNLIVTDLEMPEMDGFQFLRSIAEMKIKSSIIVASSHSEALMNSASELARLDGLNVSGTMKKPYVQESCLALLEEAVKNIYDSAIACQYGGNGLNKLSAEDVKSGLKNKALVPYYQPKVCRSKSSIIGFECLSRWKTDNNEILGPASFIPTAEENNLMGELTLTLFESVARDISRWKKRSKDLSISVNVSTDNLKDKDFPDKVCSILDKYSVSPSSITIEVTETKVMENASDCLEAMSRLCLKGFGLSVDDFGTGYSSLQQLQYSPFTELKLDRSYVAAAIYHETSKAMLTSGIELAKNLSLICVAEGVETLEQVVLLEELGCHIHQGFLYAKPMPYCDVMPWIRKWNKGEIEADWIKNLL